MGKKKMSLGILYLVGMALVAVGFCCPMFKGVFGSTANGFKFINFDNSSFVTIGALLIFVGAIAGVALSFVKAKNGNMLKFLALVLTIAGGIILVIGFNQSKAYKVLAKGFLKNAYIGFYMILVGWVVAIVGKLSK